MSGKLPERWGHDHGVWRARAAQAYQRRYAEWARVEKRLRPYVSGLESAHNILKLWELYNLPPGFIPTEDKGATLYRLLDVLGRVAEVEVWHSDLAGKLLSSLPGPRRQGAAEELWRGLLELLNPKERIRKSIMIPLATDWTIVQWVNVEEGQVALCDRYRQEVELSAFRLKWDAAANVALRVKQLRREVVSDLPWTCQIPQLSLKPPGDLQDTMDRLEDPPGLNAALENFARLDLEAGDGPRVTEENLRLIGKTLRALPDDRNKNDWRVIVKGGLRGYALYVNELVRVGWCFEQVPPYNPCSTLDARRAYPTSHPLSLVAEHKFLRLITLGQTWQTLAQSSDQNFTIKELVLANPLTKDPQEDWRTITAFDEAGRHILKREDMVERPGMVAAARAWYERNGFTGE